MINDRSFTFDLLSRKITPRHVYTYLAVKKVDGTKNYYKDTTEIIGDEDGAESKTPMTVFTFPLNLGKAEESHFLARVKIIGTRDA